MDVSVEIKKEIIIFYKDLLNTQPDYLLKLEKDETKEILQQILHSCFDKSAEIRHLSINLFEQIKISSNEIYVKNVQF